MAVDLNRKHLLEGSLSMNRINGYSEKTCFSVHGSLTVVLRQSLKIVNFSFISFHFGQNYAKKTKSR